MGAFISRSTAIETITRRMAETLWDPSGSESDSDFESLQDFPHNYSHILQSLINSFPSSSQVQIRPSSYVGSYVKNYFNNNAKMNKDDKNQTEHLNESHFSITTKQSAGVLGNKRISNTNNNNNITNMLLDRENGLYVNKNFSSGTKCKIFNRYLPNEATLLDRFSGKVFCGLFSKDGNRFLTASQDRSITLYDSSNSSYKFLHSTQAIDVGWSIIDVAFSPKGDKFVYSTWSSDLRLCSTTDNTDQQKPLCLVRSGRRFCIFSVVFSSDGRELLGGANDGCLYIYDLHRHGSTLNIPAHQQDVNSICFADDSSQIIYSGGDDGLVKVWDRRTLVESNPTPVGILAGHMDGITFIDSRGDGRHLISNSKDQSIKLWDIRVFSGEKASERCLKVVGDQTWDYRWQEVPKKLLANRPKIEGDTSVMTYRGHIVIKTLIRCRFSPKETTGQRYIYTGCGVGRVVVYDTLTGEMVQGVTGHGACVRDVDWHPERNEILSSSWDGTVNRWSYVDKSVLDDSDEYTWVYSSKSSRATRKSPRLAKRRRQ